MLGDVTAKLTVISGKNWPPFAVHSEIKFTWWLKEIFHQPDDTDDRKKSLRKDNFADLIITL
jgi:hypothetical protein